MLRQSVYQFISQYHSPYWQKGELRIYNHWCQEAKKVWVLEDLKEIQNCASIKYQ